MKKLRLISLVVALAGLLAQPALLRAQEDCDGSNPCWAFFYWCDGYCSDKGGMLLCNWGVGGCDTLCYCGNGGYVFGYGGDVCGCPAA